MNSLFLLTALFVLALAAVDNPPDFSKIAPPARLIAEDSKAAAAATVCFLEGPAVDEQGNVFFSDISGNRILRLTADGRVEVFRADSGRTNGNTFDREGRLVSCEGAENGPGGRRRIVRTDMKTGQVQVLTERFEGKRYNSPNDLCADSLGRIWFTDPRYSPDRSDLEMTVEAVYRIDADGTVVRVLSQPDVERPNGIAITPDNKTLYVIDSHPRPGGARKLWAFDISAAGSLSGKRLVYDFGKGRGGDGMRLDMEGNIWVAAGILAPRGPGENADVPPGVYVITPAGKLLGRIPILEDVITNVAFGGPERKTLYVTAGKTLYRLPIRVSGYALYPPAGR